MPSLLTNLNSAFTFSFKRVVRVSQIGSFGLVENFSLGTRSCSYKVMDVSGSTMVEKGDIFSSGNVSSVANPSGVYFGDKGGRNSRRGVLSMNSSCKAIKFPGMAVSGSTMAEKGDIFSCGNVSSMAKPSGVYFGDKGGRNSGCKGIRFLGFDSLRRSGSCNQVIAGMMNVGCGNWLIRCYADGAASEVSVDGSSPVDLDQTSTIEVQAEQETLSNTPLKLISGSCYLPHPDKEKTGGEDAHFICTEEQVIGVADGVGGWAELGIDSGYYSRELMSNSVSAIRDEPKGLIDPARVLEKAYKCTTSKGSSTACIIALTEQGLHAINLGDSGFILVRDGRTVFESPAQQHSFNFTFQLESGRNSDLPSSGQVFKIPVEPGDVIVAGTDGLFDNLYNNEVSSTVALAVSAGLSPDSMAQKLAALARQRALDKKRQTPFSAAAQEAGYHYYGGKLDDITVVVAYISARVPWTSFLFTHLLYLHSGLR